MDKVRFFREIFHLEDESLLAELGASATEQTFKAKEYITQPGTRPESVWFLVKGAVCFTVVDGSGKEIVDMAISQPGLVSNAILFEYTSVFGEKTMTDTTILSISHEKLRELLTCYPGMTLLWIRQIQLYALKYWKLRMVCANMSLAERMYWYRKVDPASFAVISNSQLASFFGASRESISRVKTRSIQLEEHYDIPGRTDSAEAFTNYFDALSKFEDTKMEIFSSGK